MQNNKTAFTFAELMIVVSIIGVIASFMIPALVRTEPNETALTYKKTVHAIETAIKNTINDTTLYPPLPTENEIAEGIPAPVVPATAVVLEGGDLRYTATINEATNLITYELDNNAEFLCTNLAENLNTIGAIRCVDADGRSDLIMDGTNNLTTATTNFTLSNGATIGGISGNWTTENDNGAVDANAIPFITLCIDVNGNQPPNVGCAIADRANERRDQFRIRINAEGRVFTGAAVGINNWLMENRMLINPRAVTRDQRPLTDREIAELTNNNNNIIIDPSAPCPDSVNDLGDYITTNDLCVYTAGFTEERILRNRQN